MSTNPLQYFVKKKPYFTNILHTLDREVLEREVHLQFRVFQIVYDLMYPNYVSIVKKLKTYEI